MWQWYPVLELEKGQSYRLHLSSLDLQHGFSLQPVNINMQVHPGYEHVLTLTPEPDRRVTASSATNTAASATTRWSARSTSST